MNKNTDTSGEELGIQARDEYIETGKTTVVCPKCHKVPRIDIQGKYYEHVNICCDCNYILFVSRGI